MPIYEIPRSHSGRLAFLNRAALTGQADINAGRTLVSQATVNRINALQLPYLTAVNAIVPTAATRGRELRERNEAIGEVQTYTRDFWEVLKRRVFRNNEDVEVFTLHGLPEDGTVPHPQTPDLWIAAALQCVNGDAMAVMRGYPTMANPSVAELMAVITAATTENDQVSEADRQHDIALANAAAQVPAVDAVLEEVMAELRFNTRSMDYPSQRRIQRTYGARFRNLPGEPSEGDRKEVIGTGNGILTSYEAILAHLPITPESLTATDGLESFTDSDNGDGTGLLTGSNGGSGSIVYATGALQVNFSTAPAIDAAITVEYVGGV
jgi:hypothetical protein